MGKVKQIDEIKAKSMSQCITKEIIVFFEILVFECFVVVSLWRPAERRGFYSIRTCDKEDRSKELS